MIKKSLTRRQFLNTAAISASLIGTAGCARTFEIIKMKRQTMKPRPDLISTDSDFD